STALGKPVAILQDLQGPKLRVGRFPNGSITIEKGEEVLLKLENRETIAKQSSKIKVIPYNYERLSKEIQTGHRILMDDGNLEVVVTNIKNTDLTAQVVFGGTLKDHKGMNFPDTRLTIEAFTPKDKEDLLLGLKLGVDYVALSFVRSAFDVRTVQRFMHAHRKNIPVISKIEKAEAITNLPDILEVTDAVMVARGDLAVEVGTAQVPSLQKKIILECNKRGIPVITATQMLESMIHTPRPTRAEASDVANAVLDGTDAVMLSAESASGKFPVLTVSVMQNIIVETESKSQTKRNATLAYISHQLLSLQSFDHLPVVEAIERAASELAESVGAKLVACTTHTGQAARALAKFRPVVPIIAFTDNVDVERRLALVWGVETIPAPSAVGLDELFQLAEVELVKRGYAKREDFVVFTAGYPPFRHGSTSVIKIIQLKTEAPDGKPKKPKDQNDNLETYRTRKAQFLIDHALCIQCGGCVEVCPNDIFAYSGRKVYLKESNCKLCTFDNACMEICPTSAIEIVKLSD
ncbi:MAG TPA: pyruvate kinase, partial [Oligoflexia bacterium]|nr:pyruvate kinase [Oligoflexia bacterium]